MVIWHEKRGCGLVRPIILIYIKAMQSDTPPPLHQSRTAHLIIELHQSGEKLEVRLKPLDAEQDPFASFGMMADHLASGAIRTLTAGFGKENCRMAHGLNYMGLKISCPQGEAPQEQAQKVIAALEALERTPEMVSGQVARERRGESEDKFTRLIEEARKKPTQFAQVEHILADTELTSEQRDMALSRLRDMRKKGGGGAGRGDPGLN